MSKRNQKRIESELIRLINHKDNANKCGECSASYPTWASVNLGIFLCGRCASLHRSLGSDISVVKSLTLDKWDDEDLDDLASIGNKKAKKFWNPKGVPFPFDDDDKDELILYVRNKYINGKFRYSPPTKEDYNLDNGPSRVKSGSRSSESSRPSSARGGSVPSLTHRDIPEIERLRYRKQEPKLKDQGFKNTDDNYEALYLAKGDLRLAAEILRNAPQDDPNEVKPALPKRPGTSSTPSYSNSSGNPPPTSSSTEWWNSNGTAPVSASTTGVNATSTGLLEPPQQYLDPATGIIYVDPVQQQQYLLQQQQLQAQQLQQQQQQQFQQPFQQAQQTGAFFSAQQQLSQPTGVFVQPQRTGIDKNQLLSLYNTGAKQQAQPQQAQFQQPQFQQQFLQNQQTQQQQPQQFYQNGFGYQ